MNKHITTFEEHLEKRYGKVGTSKRNEFEFKSKSFILGELIKEERELASMTREQLAEKSGTNSLNIAKIENGSSNVQLATLFKIIEKGLGKRLNLSIGH